MKKVLSFLTIMVITLCSYAQDIIVRKDAKKIDAKILEVSTSEIRYKELDNLDGPTFILRTNEIVTIIYANGKVVIYNNDAQNELDARLEAERRAREAAEAEKARKEAEAVAHANQMGSLFGAESNEIGQRGNPVGHGSLGSQTWSLAGRSLKGTLPQPSNAFNQEGKVIVQIRVNAAGNVVEATCKGGNVTDKRTQQLAIDAAKKAKFTEGDHDQIGTITYIFKLN